MPITFTQPITPILMALATNSETKHAHADSSLALPHLVFTVAIEDVRQALWRPVGPIATRVLQVSGGTATNAYEISAGPDGMPQVSSTTVEGPALQATLDLIERAERIAGNRLLEFRLLRAPFLHMAVAWLHSEDGVDVFLPLLVSDGTEQPIPAECLLKGSREGWSLGEMLGVLETMAKDMDRLSREHRALSGQPRRGD